MSSRRPRSSRWGCSPPRHLRQAAPRREPADPEPPGSGRHQQVPHVPWARRVARLRGARQGGARALPRDGPARLLRPQLGRRSGLLEADSAVLPLVECGRKPSLGGYHRQRRQGDAAVDREPAASQEPGDGEVARARRLSCHRRERGRPLRGRRVTIVTADFGAKQLAFAAGWPALQRIETGGGRAERQPEVEDRGRRKRRGRLPAVRTRPR